MTEKRILLIALAVFLFMGLFPPWHSSGGYFKGFNDYSFFMDSPRSAASISIGRLFVQWFMLAITTGVLIYLKRKEAHSTSVKNPRISSTEVVDGDREVNLSNKQDVTISVINGKRILVVDAEYGVRESLHYIFKGQGAFTVKAESGEDALVILKHNLFDLITTCLRMDGLNGIALIKEIRARDINTPIIVITGYATWETMKTCNELGVEIFISRPFKTEDVIMYAEKALGDTNKGAQPRWGSMNWRKGWVRRWSARMFHKL